MNRACRLATLAVLLMLAAAAGCSADAPANPSFPLTLADARRALDTMRSDPRPLKRPVLVLGGLFDPGLVTTAVARELQRVTDDDARVLTVSFSGAVDLAACRRRVLDLAETELAGGTLEAPLEVDAVGISMGGLVARMIGRPSAEDQRCVRVRRLFSIATPHQGSRLATLPTFDQRVIQMRPGSDFLAELDQPAPEVAATMIIPYVRLGDAIVGSDRAAPSGRVPWWVPNIPFSFAHLAAPLDPRILADIARRLRGEEPYTGSLHRHGPEPQTLPNRMGERWFAILRPVIQHPVPMAKLI